MDVSVLLSHLMAARYLPCPPCPPEENGQRGECGAGLPLRGRLSQQRRIYDALRDAILDARIGAGTRLPATRVLAKELGVARNSVLYAYERLVDEGFIGADRRGSVVAPLHLPPRATVTSPGGDLPRLAQRVRDIRRRAPSLASLQQAVTGAARDAGSDAAPAPLQSFLPGTPALDLFPLAQWRVSMERAWRRVGVADLGYGECGGQMRLRRVIADYLRVSRGVRCTPAQVFITDGTQTSLSLCATLLADPEETAWMEYPGYGGARAAFQAAGLQMLPVPVDDDGVNPAALDGAAQPPKLIYLTPSHQYPLGGVLSIERRLALLDAAAAQQTWIIEDDYDSEFRHEGQPLPAVQGLRADAPVLYLGTFSKTVFPGLRLAFMVVPTRLCGVFADALSILARQGRVADQLALADFIESGAYSRHLRRMRRVYAARRDALRASLERHLAGYLRISGGAGGMHLTVRLTVALEDHAVCQAALAAGLVLAPLSDYGVTGHQDPALNGFVLGYAGLSEADVDRHIATLAQVMKSLQNPAGATAESETQRSPHEQQASVSLETD